MRYAFAVVGFLALAIWSPAAATGTSPLPPSSYPSCGFYWNKNQPPSAAQLRKNACLLSARREGRKARLVAVRSTIEGDPIVLYVYVNGKLPVLLVEDTRRDAFGAGGWSQSRCNRLGASGGFLTFGGCQVWAAASRPG